MFPCKHSKLTSEYNFSENSSKTFGSSEIKLTLLILVIAYGVGKVFKHCQWYDSVEEKKNPVFRISLLMWLEVAAAGKSAICFLPFSLRKLEFSWKWFMACWVLQRKNLCQFLTVLGFTINGPICPFTKTNKQKHTTKSYWALTDHNDLGEADTQPIQKSGITFTWMTSPKFIRLALKHNR